MAGGSNYNSMADLIIMRFRIMERVNCVGYTGGKKH